MNLIKIGIIWIVFLFLEPSIHASIGATPFDGQFLVKLKSAPGIYQANSTTSDLFNGMPVKIHSINYPGDSIHTSNLDNWILVDVAPTADIGTITTQLRNHPSVKIVEPVYPVYINEKPNDPNWAAQHAIADTEWSILSSLKENTSIIAAVIDTGSDATHEDLRNMIYVNPRETANNLDDDGNGLIDDIAGYNFYEYYSGGGSANSSDGHGHGTHIAGIIGAQSNNSVGISGISTHVKILPIRFLNSGGYGSQVDGATAIRYAADMGARVINCSWGYFLLNTILSEAIDYANQKGCIVIAAAGNSSTSYPQYPAAVPGVIAVSSLDLDYSLSYYSSFGPNVAFSIFGRSIYSTIPGGYGFKSGTSQSAAMLSGLVAKILAARPGMTRTDVVELLKKSVYDLGTPGRDDYYGWGAIDPKKLLKNLNAPYSETDLAGKLRPTNVVLPADVISPNSVLTIDRFMNYPNPMQHQSGTTFGFYASVPATTRIYVYDLQGALKWQTDSTVDAGYCRIPWDGRDSMGNWIPVGTYIVVGKFITTESSIVKKWKLMVN